MCPTHRHPSLKCFQMFIDIFLYELGILSEALGQRVSQIDLGI